MPAFEYTAADPTGKPVTGVAWAEDELQLDADLDGQKLVLTRASALLDGRRRHALDISRRELIQFTTQLATVTGAGIPILEGLDGIRARLASRKARQLLGDMISALKAGESLSKVMGVYPRTFPAVYRASVVAGEASGALDRVLNRLASHMEWTRGMRATTVQALIYPAILMLAILGLVGILLFFLLPRILTLFPGGVQDLPAQTRFVLALSQGLRAQAVPLAVLGAAGAAALVHGWRSPHGRCVLERALLSLPVLGAVARGISTSKFACTSSILQSAGCDIFTVLDVSADACGNAAMAQAFRRAADRVRRGASLSGALEQEPLVDPLLLQLVGVGEKSGELDRCLERVVRHYDEELPRSVKRLLALLEPALLLGAGAIVAFILLAALLPMFQAMESMR